MIGITKSSRNRDTYPSTTPVTSHNTPHNTAVGTMAGSNRHSLNAGRRMFVAARARIGSCRTRASARNTRVHRKSEFPCSAKTPHGSLISPRLCTTLSRNMNLPRDRIQRPTTRNSRIITAAAGSAHAMSWRYGTRNMRTSSSVCWIVSRFSSFHGVSPWSDFQFQLVEKPPCPSPRQASQPENAIANHLPMSKVRKRMKTICRQATAMGAITEIRSEAGSQGCSSLPAMAWTGSGGGASSVPAEESLEKSPSMEEASAHRSPIVSFHT